MKSIQRSLIAAAIIVWAASAFAAQSAGETARLHHPQTECSACHDAVPQRGGEVVVPNAKCEACHGPMDKMQLPPNRFHKDAHHSPHYADLLECTLCHAEHKQKESLCADCHVVK